MSACAKCGKPIPGPSSPIDALAKWTCADKVTCLQRAAVMQDIHDGAALATAAFLSGRTVDDVWDEVQAIAGSPEEETE